MPAANIGGVGLSEPTAAGAERPTGDSPLERSDRAGNVAEGTATPVYTATAVYTATMDAATGAAAGDAVEQKVVKGGSFRDDAALLQPAASVTVTAEYAATWLGFRCAASTAQP